MECKLPRGGPVFLGGVVLYMWWCRHCNRDNRAIGFFFRIGWTVVSILVLVFVIISAGMKSRNGIVEGFCAFHICQKHKSIVVAI